MKQIQISGKKRETTGKKASKELRKEGMIPCNLYGEAKADGKPVAFSFVAPMSELRKLIYTPHIYLVELNIDGVNHAAIMKEIQFHPTTDAILHIDFYEVNETKPIVMGVPVKHIGLAQGVRDGGRMSLIVRKVNVRAKYKDIPETLDIDVTNMTIGKSIKVGDLSFEGLEMVTSKDVVVCTIKATRKSNVTSTDEEENPESE